jgi:hypothetical protein
MALKEQSDRAQEGKGGQCEDGQAALGDTQVKGKGGKIKGRKEETL